MKKRNGIVLSLFLAASTLSFGQEVYVTQDPAAVQDDMTVFQRAMNLFQKKYDQYKKCITGKCTPEEKSARWREVKSASWTTFKAAVVLILLFYVGKKIQKKRRMVKIHIVPPSL